MAKQPKAEATEAGPAAKATEPDPRDAMTVKQLAKAVIDRSIRPRVADVRRLAEEILKPAKPKKDKPAKAGKGGKKGKKKQARKLPKIPS